MTVSLRCILFNKPFNVVSQFTREANSNKLTLADFIDVPGVYPVGRLDHDSEGLMLLTNDGGLQHRLTNPRFGHPRTYWVQVEGSINDSAVKSLEDGVTIHGYRTRPAQASIIGEPHAPPRNPPIRYRKNIPTSWIELTLAEGRNRQVRRMTAAVGFPTLRLIRTAIGNLTVGNLEPGCWRDLHPSEIRALRQNEGHVSSTF